MTFFTKRGGTIPSTEGGRGRTTAAGRERRDLLDMNLSFFALKSRKGVRGRLEHFAMPFFAKTKEGMGRRLDRFATTLFTCKTRKDPLDLFAWAFLTFGIFKSRGTEGLLGFKFANGNSSTRAPLRAGIDGSKAWI